MHFLPRTEPPTPNPPQNRSRYHKAMSLALYPTMTDFYVGLTLGSATTLFTAVLELSSWRDVTQLLHEKGGKKLFVVGWVMNLVNNLFIGPITYVLVTTYFTTCSITKMTSVMDIVASHAVGYWIAHRSMHTRYLYSFHKFHHQYNKIVVPSTANAVSTLEYILAYMLPFVLCSIVTRPSRSSLVQAACVVSVCNIFVHTPFLKGVSQRLPWFVVSTHDHFDHHNKQKTNFAAPTLNIDRIFRLLVSVSFHNH